MCVPTLQSYTLLLYKHETFFHQHSRTMSSIATDEHSPAAFIQRHLDELQRTGTGDKASFIAAARARRAQQPELWTKEVRILCGRYLATLKRLDRLAQRREPDIARAGHLYRWGTIDLEQEGDMNDDIHRMGCFSTFQPLQPSIIFLRVACGGSFMMASTPGGALFVLGNNAFGQLAMPGNKNYPTLTEHATMRFDDPEEHNIFVGIRFPLCATGRRSLLRGVETTGGWEMVLRKMSIRSSW